MKKITLFLIFSIGLTAFLFNRVSAYDKSSVTKVYNYLKKKWSYYDIKGAKITVRSLSWRSSGNNYEIIANGKSLDPTIVYDKSGKNVLDPSKKNLAPEKKIVGNEKGIMKGMTEAHNRFRRITGGGLPGLVWDESVAAYAQEWADYLKRSNYCKMQHRRGMHKKKRWGENLAWSSGRELEPDDVVQMWYDEIKDYNYSNNSCRSVCGHYTQVIWKNSKRVGCGMAKCGRSEVWVCNYDPPGNWVGQKPY